MKVDMPLKQRNQIKANNPEETDKETEVNRD